MNFLEKIEPYLITDDVILQKFVLNALYDYPEVPEEWTERLLRETLRAKEKESTIFKYASHHSLNREAVATIIEGFGKKGLEQLFWNIDPELALQFQNEFNPHLKKDMWDFYHLLFHGEEEAIWQAYTTIQGELEEASEFDQSLYSKAKRLVKTLVQNGWFPESEADYLLKEEINEEWFTFKGIFTVYAIGLLGWKKYIPLLTRLLDRDEDLLLEEVCTSLIAFQSDEVVEAVVPFLSNQDTFIYAVSVLENTKTDVALEALLKVAGDISDADDQAIVIEALCHHLSPQTFPILEDFMKKSYDSYMVDMEQVAYSFYTIMGQQHPDLNKWKQIAAERKANFRKKGN
jgi:hypothetical protein